MNLLDAFARQSDIRYLSTRHEQVAAFMADGFARASGRVGVCLASRGPGAANMAIAVHNAYAESIPVLAVIGQVPDALYWRDAFEEMDLLTFFTPLTKWAVEVHEVERIPELLQRAIRTTEGGRPRPVMVSLPLDVQQSPAPPDVDLQPVFRHRHPVPDPRDIAEAAALLAGARRPVIIAGGGASAAAQELLAFAELLSAPLVTTWLRKGAVANDAATFMGSLGYGAFDVTERTVTEADVILSVGCRFDEFTSKRWTLLPPKAALISIDVDPDEIGRVYVPRIGLPGDARATLTSLTSNLTPRPSGPAAKQRTRRLAAFRAEYVTGLRLEPDGQQTPVPSAALVKHLTAGIDRHDAILVQDVHTFGPWIHRYLPMRRPGRYFAAAGGSMGWGFPAALGVQLARPTERVVCVAGDGSFWMVAQDLETAVREDIPVVVVVVNNFAYGNTRDRQRTAHSGRHLGVFHTNPDFAAFAKLLGAYGERVERADDFPAALDRAIASGLPAVLDVIQNQSEGLPADLLPPAAS